MAGYTKLFSSILDSSIWNESAPTRLVWVTLLAMADQNGIVDASVPGLANRARVTLDECQKALDVLSGPDEWSRTETDAGRRIEKIDGGWRLINHAKYRENRDPEKRREQNREAQQRWRDRQKRKPNVSQDKPPVSRDKPGSAQAEAEAEATKKDNGAYPLWFDAFWEAYPRNKAGRRRGKRKTFDLAKRLVPADDRPALIQAAENYAREADPEYVRDPERFVKADWWRDHLGEAKTVSAYKESKPTDQQRAEQIRFRLIRAGHSAARNWTVAELLAHGSER